MSITVGEFKQLHDILTAAAEQELSHPAPVPDAVKELLAGRDGAAQPASGPTQQWLALLNLAVNPHLLRRYIKDQKEVAEEPIRAMIRFLVIKRPHIDTDRDKLDWVATYLFQAREERTKQPTGWPKAEVYDILKGVEFPALSGDASSLLEEITSLLEEIRHCAKFSELTDARVIERGRVLKNRFGDEFFHPDVLTPVVNYNLISGKAFHALLQQTMQKVREFTGHRSAAGPTDTHELLRSDYRSNTSVFHNLSELGRTKQGAEKPAGAQEKEQQRAPEPVSGAKKVEEELKQLGINVVVEAVDLKRRQDEITNQLKANPALIFLHGARGSLPLMEWEASAIRSDYPDGENSFRVDFAHELQRTVALLSRIDEELAAYEEKKESEYLWKKHYDSLIYLLQQGRSQKETLSQLSAASQKKGLADKSRQLLQSAARLETALAQVTAVF